MAEEKTIRLSQINSELKVKLGTHSLIEKLEKQGLTGLNLNSKITFPQLKVLADELGASMPQPKPQQEEEKKPVNNTSVNNTSNNVENQNNSTKHFPQPQKVETEVEVIKANPSGLKILGKIDLSTIPKDFNSKNEIDKYITPNQRNTNNKTKTQNTKRNDKTDQPKNEQNLSKENNTRNDNNRNENNRNRNNDRRNTPKNNDAEVKTNLLDKQTNEKPVSEKTNNEKPKRTENPKNQEPKNEKIIEKSTEKPTEKSVEVSVEKKPEIVEAEIPVELIKAKADQLGGLKVLGKIQLPSENKRNGNNQRSGNNNSNNSQNNQQNDDKKRRRRKKRVRREDNNVMANAIQNAQGNNNQTTNNNTQNPNNNSQTNNNTQNNNNSQNNNNTQNRNNNSQNNNNTQNRNNTSQNNNNTQNRNNTSQNNNNTQNRNNTSQNNNNTQNRNNTSQNNNNRNNNNRNNNTQNRPTNNVASEKEIQEQIKATLAKLDNKNTGNKIGRSTKKREKTRQMAENVKEDTSKILKVAEFISANDLASLMDISVNQIIAAGMSMGMLISINQRLDAELITVIADEFEYSVEFISANNEEVVTEVDAPESLVERAPIVTVMGHVDHGKTSLLDYIRKANVVSKESGGITQHIGAYDVITKEGRKITFLDTPGHEAFTAMRARGAKVTDIVILMVSADDSVRPQTEEAINHARAAGVPIIVALNKIDRPTADPEKIRKQLADKNILVETWGGKHQEQEISAKKGTGIDELLTKILLEAEMLELTANPDRRAEGTVLESSLDKGKGYVANILVQKGTLKIGDIMLVGSHFGRVKAMYDHRGKKVQEAGPSMPVQVLGLDGSTQAGDLLKVMPSEREARDIATKRSQIIREQAIRAAPTITLKEIGRRRALGTFQELKLIIKGDFDGSVEALSDSLLKLSTEEIKITIIHKGVGQITENDVLLASTAETGAIIIGFQVRPSINAKKIADDKKIEIKLYSIIYDAINEIKDAMEGMLAPKVEEVIVGNVEVRDVFKISKIGTVAGCYVTDGFIKRSNKVRIIRDGIVTYQGEIGALKRFKDDVSEVKYNYECGLSIRNFNDLKVGDVIESYEERETKRTLN